jgi:hypothetical protein
MITAKHFPGVMPRAVARRLPARCRSAIATTWGTVKLTVAVTVIPSATHSSSTSSPAAVAGSFTAIFGAQAWKALRHRIHAIAIGCADRIDLGADEAAAAAALLEGREQLLRRPGDGDFHQSFGLLLGGQPAGERSIDIGAPALAVALERSRGQHRVGRDADGAPAQAELELAGVGRVVPPLRGGVFDHPIQICHEGYRPPR